MKSVRRLTWGHATCALVAVLLILPILIVVPMSFTGGSTIEFPPTGWSLRWYQAIFEDPKWSLRVPVSVDAAIGTTVLATILGTLAALGLTRGTFRGKHLASALFLSPLLVPVVVLATGEFFVMATGWQLGPWTLGGGLVGTIPGLILAHTVLALPYPTILVSASLRTIDRDLDLAAANLGAGPWTRFRRITLPLIAPGLFAGAVFAFLASWDEVVMASFLTSGRISTVPVQIFTDLRESLSPAAAAISSMLLLITLMLFAVMTISSRGSREPAAGGRKSDKNRDGDRP